MFDRKECGQSYETFSSDIHNNNRSNTGMTAAPQQEEEHDMYQEYYRFDPFVPRFNSPNQIWDFDMDDDVNKIDPRDINSIVEDWLDNDTYFNYESRVNRPDLMAHPNNNNFTYYPKDDLVPTGKAKHSQATVSKKRLIHVLERNYWAEFKKEQLKLSRHRVYWRYQNHGALIPRNLQISHTDRDHNLLILCAESKNLNESRKYCHLYGWTGTNGLCPHRYFPCS
jgi:hypothetical protein